MSINLKLYAGGPRRGERCRELYQTPTDVTLEATANGANAKLVYYRWLDAWVESLKPKIHPRASNAQRKAILSGGSYKDYLAFAQQIEEHKQEIEQFLKEHPDAAWVGV